MTRAIEPRHPLARKRWLAVGLPLAGFAFLVAIAPPLPESTTPRSEVLEAGWAANGEAFRYRPDRSVHALDLDPRQVQVELFEGWDREQDAYSDGSALAFVSGPMYERHLDASGREVTVPLGDLKLGRRIWRGRNRTAARQRAYVGIRHDGRVDFGYGELTPERSRLYDTFIGGLHSVYNDLERPPASYRGAYSISMGQQIRYFLPRIRMLIGLRSDGRLEVLMSRDGLTLEQTRSLARQRGLRAAYLSDHASKSRFIIPRVKGFSQEDANWISGGATSYVHVPYMLRLSRRPLPLQGDLLAALTPKSGSGTCGNPLGCGQRLGGQLLDRALAGLNRLMEQGVEPIARLIWAPKDQILPNRPDQRQPLREPPITADPLALREPATVPDSADGALDLPLEPVPLPPDLPEPFVLEEGQELPPEGEEGPIDPSQGTTQPQGGTPTWTPLEPGGDGGAQGSSGAGRPLAAPGQPEAPQLPAPGLP